MMGVLPTRSVVWDTSLRQAHRERGWIRRAANSINGSLFNQSWRQCLSLALAACGMTAGVGSAALADNVNGISSRHYSLVGVLFDDGGPAGGGFDFWPSIATLPPPQIFNVQMITGAGLLLPGSSTFSFVTSCYDPDKHLICGPSDNLLIYVETGTYGQPGYDRYQFGTFLAPNLSPSSALDPKVSFEMSCTADGCLTRHIVAGTLVQTFPALAPPRSPNAYAPRPLPLPASATLGSSSTSGSNSP